MNNLLFVLLKNFNISSLRFIILSVFFKNNITFLMLFSNLWKILFIEKQLNLKKH